MNLKKIFQKKPHTSPLEIAGHKVKIEVRAQSKSLRLRIDPLSGQPILSTPRYATNRQINSFLEKSEAWIQKNARNIESQAPQTHIYIDGQQFQICRTGPHKRAKLDWASHVLHLPDTLKHPQKSLHALLKPIAHQKLQLISMDLAHELGVNFQSLEVREYKARWGSCSHDRHLSYSWRLILAPPHILRYVCAHEVSHLVHMDHSAQFWATVAKLDPLYKSHRQWLRKNGNKLFINHH